MTTADSFWRGKRVLLTGHTGFKGAWLSAWLLHRGAEVFGLAKAPVTEDDLYPRARLDRSMTSIIGDIRSFDSVNAAYASSRPDIVMHLAAQALVKQSYDDPIETYGTNVMGTVNVLEAARRHSSVRAVVNVTSDKCYENREWAWAYRENEPMGGADPYSSSKGCAELVASAWRRSYFSAPQADGRYVGLASARAGNVIGGGDWAQNRLLPDCVRAMSRGEAVVVRSPHAIRPWQHVLEPLSGYMLLAQRLWTDGPKFADGWNFGPMDDGRPAPVSAIVARVVDLWGNGASWSLDGAVHPHEASYLRVDSSKAVASLNWRPRLDLDDALSWTIEFYKRQLSGEPVAGLLTEQIKRYESRGTH